MPNMEDAEHVLKSTFGYNRFRFGQERSIRVLLSKHDLLAVMPTGSGKSLCYQVPALVFGGLAIVISPLVSLMGDQVRALTDAGVCAAYLNSSLALWEQNHVYSQARNGTYKILYLAPERLEDPRFLELAKYVSISFVAIDEAHCVSQWGQDFRPSYLKIAHFIESLSERPVVAAFTATATKRVQADISQLLQLRDPEVVVTGFDRPNLHFSVERQETKNKISRVLELVSTHAGESGIIYCSTRKAVDDLHVALIESGVKAVKYHAGMLHHERSKSRRAFVSDDVPVMVATNAFGMGIDKSNVRYVVHNNMPASLEAYYQEAGRAGRDGEPSECVLLWNDADISTGRFFIEREGANEEVSAEELEVLRAVRRRMLAAMCGYCLTAGCLRKYLLSYFGETWEDVSDCKNCSNCSDNKEMIDVTKDARAIMRCVQELRGRYGKSVVADVLCGSKSKKLASMKLDKCRSFNTVRASPTQIKEVIELLVSGGYLEITEGRYPLVGFGHKYREAAAHDFELKMKRMVKKRGYAEKAVQIDFRDYDYELFKCLRALRKRLADKAAVAPYVVFSDANLRDMCIKLPHTKEEFLQVNGVGDIKLERYGDAFLKEIADYTSKNMGMVLVGNNTIRISRRR